MPEKELITKELLEEEYRLGKEYYSKLLKEAKKIIKNMISKVI